MPEILLVYDRSELEVGSVLESELVRVFKEQGASANVTISLSEDNARQKLPGQFSLVITPLNIRKAPLTPLSQEEEEGLELLRWMNACQMNKPSILIASTYTAKMRSAQPELKNCYVVLSGANMVTEVIEHALKMVDKPSARCLEVEIDLRSETQWTYRLIGKGFVFSYESELSIDGPTIEDLKLYSRMIEDSKLWKDGLLKFGSKLLEALGRDRDFMWNVTDGLLQAGGESHARVRFVVKPDLHCLALEAVLCPGARDRYWMLSAPVYRRLLVNEPSTGGYLFEGGQRIDCLIIDATTSGLVQDLGRFFPKTDNVSKECDSVQRQLEQSKSRFNIGEVRLLRARQGDPPLAQQVKAALESQDWGIVHYGGHSHYDDKNDTGYVFFPGSMEGSIEKVDSKRFSDWLRRVTFTYFSSCDSGAGPFVFGLASRRVSNILGFRWEIDDTFAFEYALEFYRTLFESRSLEGAFLKARQQMYERHPDDRIWASPILIKQLSDS